MGRTLITFHLFICLEFVKEEWFQEEDTRFKTVITLLYTLASLFLLFCGEEGESRKRGYAFLSYWGIYHSKPQ